jgi:hypothetical protein
MPYYLPEDGIGYLDFKEFDRFRRAWSTAMQLLPWWWVAGEIRSGDSDAMKTRGEFGQINLPATYLAADAITRLMNELNQWRELEDIAHDSYGSEQARVLTREVETAAAKWPTEDKPHRVKFFRCMSCEQQTLRYYPPEVYEGELLDVRVKCSNCNAVMDSDMFAFAAAVIEAEEKDRERRRLDLDKRRPRTDRQIKSDDLPVGESEVGSDVATDVDAVRVSA